MKAMRAAVVLLAAACAGGVPDEGQTPASVPDEVLSRGETVYFGTTFALSGGEEPLFVYERRTGDGVSTHITRSPAGALQLVDSAKHSVDYLLEQYTLHTDQLGHTGSIVVTDDEVRFEQNIGGQTAAKVEKKSDPVVVGPTLVGFMHARLEALRKGEALPIRFAVLDRLETIGFDLCLAEEKEGELRIKMAPTSPIIALAVAPVFFTFDAATENLVRIEGRVPPKVLQNGRWFDLDARVEYRFVVERYR